MKTYLPAILEAARQRTGQIAGMPEGIETL
jgi:hypothetical protein